jgi:hypothetical protein
MPDANAFARHDALAERMLTGALTSAEAAEIAEMLADWRAKKRDALRGVLDDMIRLDDFAAAVGRCAETIRRWARTGDGPPIVKIAGAAYLFVDDVQEWKRAQAEKQRAAHRRRRADTDAPRRGGRR